MSSVLQAWVMELGWKMQSILQSGFRGPDQGHHPPVKAVNRWLRSVSQENADPSKPYMRRGELPSDLELCEPLAYCSCHYVHHLADALRVVAIFHPDKEVRDRAWGYHYRIAEELFHFMIEDDPTFRDRHRDKVEHS